MYDCPVWIFQFSFVIYELLDHVIFPYWKQTAGWFLCWWQVTCSSRCVISILRIVHFISNTFIQTISLVKWSAKEMKKKSQQEKNSSYNNKQKHVAATKCNQQQGLFKVCWWLVRLLVMCLSRSSTICNLATMPRIIYLFNTNGRFSEENLQYYRLFPPTFFRYRQQLWQKKRNRNEITGKPEFRTGRCN